MALKRVDFESLLNVKQFLGTADYTLFSSQHFFYQGLCMAIHIRLKEVCMTVKITLGNFKKIYDEIVHNFHTNFFFE